MPGVKVPVGGWSEETTVNYRVSSTPGHPGNCLTVFDCLSLMLPTISVFKRCSTFVY